MITEGLLPYLPASTVEALAAEAATHGGIAHWISDIATSAFSKVLGGGTDTMEPIRRVQASDALKGEQILEVLKTQRLEDVSDAELYHRRWVRAGTRPADDGRRYPSSATVSAERSDRSAPFRPYVIESINSNSLNTTKGDRKDDLMLDEIASLTQATETKQDCEWYRLFYKGECQ